MDSIELLRDDLNTWRAAHRGRRGPLPIGLRRRAGVFALALGEDLVAEELDLDSKLLVAWGDRYGRVTAHERAALARSAFVEVRPQVASPACGASAAGVCVEVVRPGGACVRITGAITAALLEAVVRGAGVAGAGT